MTPTTNPPEPMPTENKTPEQLTPLTLRQIAEEAAERLRPIDTEHFGAIAQRAIANIVEQALTQSTAAQSSEQTRNSRCHGVPMIENAMGLWECPCTYYAHQIASLKEQLEAERKGWPHEQPLHDEPLDRQIILLNRQVEQQSLEIERLNARIQELEEVLTALRDAVKLEPAMNNMKYDALGARVNKSLTSSPQTSEPHKERCKFCNELTDDWIDPDWAGGRICRKCEPIHEPEYLKQKSPQNGEKGEKV